MPAEEDRIAQTGGDDAKIVYLLEMSSPDELRPKPSPESSLEVRQAEIPSPELNWFLHEAVGTPHRWGGRESWDAAAWARYVERPELKTWIAYVAGTPAGYFELEKQDDGSVRIQCFGLLPRFVGRGLGGHLLTVALERAWEMTSTRVWLKTCSHDHEHALPNYRARGLRLAGETREPPNAERRSAFFTHL